MSEHGFTEEEKKQIKALTAAVVGELQSNEKEVARLAGQSIHYGQIIQLMHSKSNKCLSLSFVSSPADPSSLTAVLNNHQPSKACYFRILSEFKMRSEGEKVRIGDRILLQSVKSGGYLSIAADGGGSGGGGSRAHVETELDKTPLRHQQWLESIISNSSQTSWQVHCFQDFKTSMEDLRSDNLFRFYNKEMESYLAASYGAKSIGLMSHEFDIAKPRQLNDAAIYWQIKPIGEVILGSFR